MEVYLAVAALAVLSVIGVVAAAARPGRVREHDSAGALFADRRRELTREADAQGLGDEELAAIEEELALDHLDESARLDRPGETAPGPRVPRFPLLVGSISTAAVAICLYVVWGEPAAPVLTRASEIMSGEDRAEMMALERALGDRLGRASADANAWFALGHLRMQLEDYDGAAAAFAGLHEVAGPLVDVDVAWAQARYRADGGEMSPATRAIVDRVLVEQPHHPAMLELLVVDAIHRRDFPAAVEQLTRVLRQSMPASRRREYEEVLALARSRLPDGEAVTESDSPTGESPTGISISISLAASLQADSGTRVFVIARDPDAPRPPLAVRRLAVGDLPARIELTDADAMMPGRTLSDLDSVELLARVSLSGSPTAQPGDYESEVAIAKSGGEPVALRIEHRLP